MSRCVSCSEFAPLDVRDLCQTCAAILDRPDRQDGIEDGDLAARWLERVADDYADVRQWWRGRRSPQKFEASKSPDWLGIKTPATQRESTRDTQGERDPSVFNLTLAEHSLVARWSPQLLSMALHDGTTLNEFDQTDPFRDPPVNEGRSSGKLSDDWDDDETHRRDRLRAIGVAAATRTDFLHDGWLITHTSPRRVRLDALAVRRIIETRLRPSFPLEELGASTRGAGRPNYDRRLKRAELARIVFAIPGAMVTNETLASALHTSVQTIKALRNSSTCRKSGDTIPPRLSNEALRRTEGAAQTETAAEHGAGE